MTASENRIRNNLKVIDEMLDRVNVVIQDSDILNYSMFIHLLSLIPDFRDQTLTKYDVSEIMGTIIMAKLKAQASSFLAIEAYGIADRKYLLETGIAKGEKCPSHDTFRRFVMCLDGETMRNLVFEWLDKMCCIADSFVGHSQVRMLSGDGKVNRGTGRKDGKRNINILNIFDISSKSCIESIPIGKKESEVPALQKAMESMRLSRTIITGDALHCNKKTCQIINRKKGFYLFTLKENRPSELAELTTRFEQYDAGSRAIGELYHYEGNDRKIDVITLKKADISSMWPGVKAYVRMISRTHDKKTWADPQYFLTSLKDNETIVEAVERRWEIEGDYHYFKDEVLKEDEQTFMDETANKNMAIINSVLYRLFKLAQHTLRDKRLQITKMRFQLRPLETMEEALLTLETLNVSEKIKEFCR